MNSRNIIDDQICLSFHESLLRYADIKLLLGPHWLNDQIISFYFEYLEKNKYQTNFDMLFISPEVTQCLKIVPNEDLNIFLQPLDAQSKNIIFFPLNNNATPNEVGGTHWSLLVFCRRENRFYHFDSSGDSNFELSQKFVRKIKFCMNCPTVTCKSMRCLQQTNNYDCGIHVICMTDQLSDYANQYNMIEGGGRLSSNTVKNKRNEIIKLIVSLGGKI